MSDPYTDFPLWMDHPSFQAAVISDAWAPPPGYPAGMPWSPPVGYEPPKGKPAVWPPVQVNNPDQEEYQASRGYMRRKVSRKQAQEVRDLAIIPQGHEHQEWPRIVNGKLEQDPRLPPPEKGEYPKYVRADGIEKLVKSRAEEQAFLEAHKPEPPLKSEAELEFLAAIAEAEGQQPVVEDEDELEALRKRAEALGIEVDGRWKEHRLRVEIEGAEHAARNQSR